MTEWGRYEAVAGLASGYQMALPEEVCPQYHQALVFITHEEEG